MVQQMVQLRLSQSVYLYYARWVCQIGMPEGRPEVDSSAGGADRMIYLPRLT